MNQQKAITGEDIRKLVVARLRFFSGDRKVSIGFEGGFSTEELIDHVKKNDEVGRKIIGIQLQYLQSFKEGVFLPD